ncbi:hypothetical protein [Bacillus sp. NPDC094106]|uniref:hypothetical protein n=1 Tax=Bacillus sp. NPDC094106 TaxID=3363949 RepID=UPI0038242780
MKKTADEIMKSIEEMNNSERIKLLGSLFDKYFDNRPPKEELEKEKEKMLWGENDEE